MEHELQDVHFGIWHSHHHVQFTFHCQNAQMVKSRSMKYVDMD